MKPGFKTTEFWLTLVTLLGLMSLAGYGMSQQGADTAAIIGALGAALSTIGYSLARAKVKKAEELKSEAKVDE